MTKQWMSMAVVVLLSGYLAACSGGPQSGANTQATDMAGGSGADGGAGGSGMHRPGGESYGLSGPGAAEALTANGYRIHFAFNSDLLSAEATHLLQQNASWLRSNPSTLMVEGHCDERGTREFNLALGQKRAESVKRYLVSQGVAATTIQTVSFGKERPVNPGHEEGAWALNRRSEVLISK